MHNVMYHYHLRSSLAWCSFVAAQELGLANVTAIRTSTAPADFEHGANFAIISATANNGSFFAGKGMDITPFSLDTQMIWFRAHMQQLAQQNSKS